MTDIYLDESGDLIIENGQVPLIKNKEQFIKQRLEVSIGTVAGELFTDLTFGVPRDLIFSKGRSAMLDSEIVRIIKNTDGVVKILEYNSNTNKSTREHLISFTVECVGGEIYTLENLKVK